MGKLTATGLPQDSIQREPQQLRSETMSGEKRRYVRVEEAELRRMQEQESRLRAVGRDLPERLNAIAQQARQEFQQRLAPMEQRAWRQEQQTQRLNSNLARLEENTHQRLRKQREEFQAAVQEVQWRQQQALQAEINHLKSAMSSGFAQQRKEYLLMLQQSRQEWTNLWTEERRARQQGQQMLQQQIDHIFTEIQQDQQKKAQLARDWLTDVQEIYSQIDREYSHHRFAPGRLKDLGRSLEMAKANIEAGVSEAAIATTQRTYLDLVDLRLELEQKEQEWLLLYTTALQDIRSLIAEVRANRECEIEVGEDLDAEQFKFEVDYWVNGALTQYEQELSEREALLTTGESTLTLEQLKDLGEKIVTLQPRLGDILQQAKLAILSSQLRAEIADRIVDALSSCGYTLVDPHTDALYEDHDERQAYVVKMKNIAGDEVVTVISPDQKFGVNSISINTFSPILVDEKATQENAKAIFQRLDEEGIKGSSPLECYEHPREEYRDLQQAIKPQTALAPAKSAENSH